MKCMDGPVARAGRGPGEMMALCEETVFYLDMSEEEESTKKTNKQLLSTCFYLTQSWTSLPKQLGKKR